jgi:hypothetical protein
MIVALVMVSMRSCSSSEAETLAPAFQVPPWQSWSSAFPGLTPRRGIQSLKLGRLRQEGTCLQRAMQGQTLKSSGLGTVVRFKGPSLARDAGAEPAKHTEGNRSDKLLLIKGMPNSMDEEYLMAIFKTYGAVRWVRIAAAGDGKGTKSGYVLFDTEEAATAARADMDGAEVCGTEDCKLVEVAVARAEASTSELVSHRLLERIQAAKRQLRLYQRTSVQDDILYPPSSYTFTLDRASASETAAASPDAGLVEQDASAPVIFRNLTDDTPLRPNLAAQGKAIGPDADDVNERFNEFLHGLRSLLPQSAPTAHASISNVSALGLAFAPQSAGAMHRSKQTGTLNRFASGSEAEARPQRGKQRSSHGKGRDARGGKDASKRGSGMRGRGGHRGRVYVQRRRGESMEGRGGHENRAGGSAQ